MIFNVNDLTCPVLFIWPHKGQAPWKPIIHILFYGSVGNQALVDLSYQSSLQILTLLNFSLHTLKLLKVLKVVTVHA